MMIGYPEAILIVAGGILLVAFGALTSSLLNHRKLSKLQRSADAAKVSADAAKVSADEARKSAERAVTNARTVEEAHFRDRQQPHEVTIVNKAKEPVPVEEIAGKE